MEKEFSDIFDRFGQSLEERKNKFGGRDMQFNENYHTENKSEWIVNLYLELDRFILGLKSGIRKEYLESYVKFSYNGLLFCYILLRRENLRIWAKIPYNSLGSVPLFIRDYEPTSRRVGVMIIFADQREFVQNKEAMLEVTHNIIKKALQKVANRKGRKVKTPLKPITEIEPVKLIEKIKPISIDISVNNNGDININLKLKKDQRGILERILQETIFK